MLRTHEYHVRGADNRWVVSKLVVHERPTYLDGASLDVVKTVSRMVGSSMLRKQGQQHRVTQSW
jgi:hypothetical protein